MASSDDQGTYIGRANVAQPEDIDLAAKGAAEIRQIKIQAANTFPNFTGEAVMASEAELSALMGVNGVVETRLNALESSAPGQVSGPPSTVDGRVAVFDGTNGKQIRDDGVALSDLATNAALALKAPLDTPNFNNPLKGSLPIATQAYADSTATSAAATKSKVVVTAGVVAHGHAIPPLDGYSRSQMKYIINDSGTSSTFNNCGAKSVSVNQSTGVVTCQVSVWSVIGDSCVNKACSVNYVCIGVK